LRERLLIANFIAESRELDALNIKRMSRWLVLFEKILVSRCVGSLYRSADNAVVFLRLL